MSWYRLILICCGVSVVVSIPSLGVIKKVKSIDFTHETCKDVPPPPWQMDIKGKGMKDGKFHLSVNFTLTEDAPNIVKETITARRCPLNKPNSCSIFLTKHINNLCDSLKEHADNPAIQAIHPKAACPIKKGTYIAEDAPIDTSAAAVFPGVDRWIWKTRNELNDAETGKLLGCGTGSTRITLE